MQRHIGGIMEKRFYALAIIVTLLTSTLVPSSKVKTVTAQETIYIRVDGSIDPATVPISTVDNVTYILTGNITSDADGIVIERNNIVIDGAGYTVRGNGTGTGIYLPGRSNITIKNTDVKCFSNGIVLQGSNNNRISGNNITEIYWIAIYSSSLSSNNIFSGNNVANNGYGISLSSSPSNIVSKNTVTNNGLYGITLSDDISVNNTISENTMANNNYNIYSVGGSDNTISRNDIANNTYGIFLLSSSSTISENTITNNEYGIWLNYPSNNRFYHNSFIDNTVQVVPHLVSIWDDGYPSGGNYWSDYVGMDLFSGPFQNETGSDVIGDTPYVIAANNTDNYPLMIPWGSLLGDVNGDGYVGIDDIFLVATHFGRELGDPYYYRIYDLNGDGYIGVDDIFTVAKHFGQENP
jgi:parallel beta-helix repeat protein